VHSYVALLVALFLSFTASANAQQPQRIVVDTPEQARSVDLYNEGIKLLSAGNAAAARQKFKEAIDLNPKLSQAHFNYGIALVDSRQYSDALTAFNKVIALQSNSPEAWLNKGICYERMGNLQLAVDCFKTYLKLKPNAANAAEIQQHLAAFEREIARCPVKVPISAENYLEEIIPDGLMRWSPQRMPLKIYVKDGTQIPNFKPEYDGVVMQCFADWASASEGKVRFTYIDDPAKADITVTWTNNPEELITAAEGGHAQVTMDGVHIVRCKIALLTTTVHGRIIDAPTIRRCALHEIGHGLGMSGHSSAPDDIMFAVTDESRKETNLTARDGKTLVALYSQDDAFAAKHPINAVRVAAGGDPNSPVVKAVKLNAEGVIALRAKNYDLAKTKFEESLKLRPGEAAAQRNLGSVYRWKAYQARLAGNNTEAATLLGKAIQLYEGAKSPDALKVALSEYATVLKSLGRTDEAGKVQARISSFNK
jgi:tetratricopeptide (TPR) repeat protein